MNCIILLLLLGCCGGLGNDCGCGNEGRSGNNCGCRNEIRGGCASDSDCRNSREGGMRRDSDKRNGGRRNPDPDCGRCSDDCCQENQPRRGNDCGCVQEERESCDIPGMIPPPWQEYPKFPHRDNGEDCEG